MPETRGQARRTYRERACQLPDTVLMQIIAWSGTAPFCKQWRGAFQAMTADPQQMATWLLARRGNKEKALLRAVRAGKPSLAQILLEWGANVHYRNGAALAHAALQGSVEMMRLLLDFGADLFVEKEVAMLGAISSGDLDCVRLLLVRGGGRAEDMVTFAVDKDRVEVMCILLDHLDPTGLSHAPRALVWAAHTGQLGTIQVLLDRGVSVTGLDGTLALYAADRAGHVGAADLLKAHGATMQQEL